MKLRFKATLSAFALVTLATTLHAAPAAADVPHQEAACAVPSNSNWCDTWDAVSATSAHVLHIATSKTSQPYQLYVTDENNGQVIYSVTFQGNQSVWLSKVYSAYTAQVSCWFNCPGTTVWMANY